jgi:rod shape-determining protein MreD
MQPTNRSSRIAAAGEACGFVMLTLVTGAVPQLHPGPAICYAVPDFVALVLAFWCVREPHRVSIGTAFLFGRAGGHRARCRALGQHAFAYVLVAYAANGLSTRGVCYGSHHGGAGPPHGAAALPGARWSWSSLRLLAGGRVSRLVEYFFTCFVAAVLWIPVHYVLLLPQYAARLTEMRTDNGES